MFFVVHLKPPSEFMMVGFEDYIFGWSCVWDLYVLEQKLVAIQQYTIHLHLIEICPQYQCKVRD